MNDLMRQPLASFLRRAKVETSLGRVGRGAALISFLTFASGLSAAPAPTRPLALTDFFQGQLRGTGAEQDSEHGSRTVSFSGVGTRTADGLRLTYDVVFSDGERQHKVWTFTQEGPGRYIGRRADVIGDANVTQNGNDIHMTYTAQVATKSGSHNLSFDEHFTRTGPGTLVNQLTASYLFLRVASGTIAIHKVAACAPRSPCARSAGANAHGRSS